MRNKLQGSFLIVMLSVPTHVLLSVVMLGVVAPLILLPRYYNSKETREREKEKKRKKERERERERDKDR